MNFTYNNDFRIASESVNSVQPIPFQHDADGLLIQAGVLTISRNLQHGLITGTMLGTVTDTRAYNGFGELLDYRAAIGGPAVYSTQHTRDALGRITQKIETVQGVTSTYVYTYDPAGRLVEVTKDGLIVSQYTYDANSNRLSHTTSAGILTGTYDAQDRLLTYGGNTYSYTANGELQGKSGAAGTTSYQYDALGNLLAVTLSNGTQIEYLIDGRNRRIGKKVNGVLVQGFLYKNPLKPIAELDGAGTVVSRFVYATKANAPDYMVKGGVTYRIFSDHLGSPRLVVDVTTGAIAHRIDYDEFGNVLQDTNPGFQPFGFAGGLYDPHTKLTRFGARDYDAETGRWTAKDPIRFDGDGPNLYEYVFSNPDNFIDPDGKGAISFGICVGLSTYHTITILLPLNELYEELRRLDQQLQDIESSCKTLEDRIKRDEEIRELERKKLEITEKITKLEGKAVTYGIPIALLCTASVVPGFLP